MRKFKANEKLLRMELLNLGYTDCVTYRHSGLNIIAVKDGLIKRNYYRGYFSDFDNQSDFNEFVKNIDKLLKQ